MCDHSKPGFFFHNLYTVNRDYQSTFFTSFKNSRYCRDAGNLNPVWSLTFCNRNNFFVPYWQRTTYIVEYRERGKSSTCGVMPRGSASPPQASVSFRRRGWCLLNGLEIASWNFPLPGSVYPGQTVADGWARPSVETREPESQGTRPPCPPAPCQPRRRERSGQREEAESTAADRGLLSGAATWRGEERFQGGGAGRSRSAACGAASTHLACS